MSMFATSIVVPFKMCFRCIHQTADKDPAVGGILRTPVKDVVWRWGPRGG